MSMKTHTELRWKFDEEIMKDEAAKLGVKLNFQGLTTARRLRPPSLKIC
jgi:hypothetical protein